MSEPAKLQKRLSTEFEGVTPRRDGEPVRDEIPGENAAGSDKSTGNEARYAGFARPLTIVPIVACAGLLFSLFALIAGAAAGFYLAAAGLGFLGIAGSLALIAQHVTAYRGTDISERMKDRDWERNETSHVLSAIHDVLGDILVTRSLDGRIVQCNSVLLDLAGGEVKGKTCEEVGLVFRSQTHAYRYDVDIETVQGRRTYSWHDITMREPSSGQLIIQSIARDVTEERRADNERETARQKAEQASEAKSRLLATVSHEIRTPLSGILGMSHLIGQTRLTAEQKNYLAGVRQSGHALVQLVDDLLDFSTIEAGRFQLRPSEEPIRPMLEAVVEMLSHRAHEKGIEIGSFVSPKVPGTITFDAPRLRQVLYNVVGNAVKFTHSGGVSLETRLDGEILTIAVSDTGPGMSQEEQARIFDEFEQAGGLAQRSGGTGLGLAISARILREAGGSLTLNSEPGKGSCFIIRMPVSGLEAGAAKATRKGLLRDTRVFLFAPVGPASAALARTITALGGHCHHASTVDEAMDTMQHLSMKRLALTDIIVDNRLSGQFRRDLAHLDALSAEGVRRTYLVNPEERTTRMVGNGEGYDAWLIRPLRERTLVEVLRGRMRGIEKRDAINDNRPVLKEPPAVVDDTPAATGGEILLAEDDPVNAMLVRSVLEKAGHKVRLVGDYPSLLATLEETAATLPDIVITDFGMPGGDGLEVICRLRREEREKGSAPTPLIVLTADTRAPLRHQLMAAGANAVLAKPAEPQVLVAEVGRFLQRSAI
ncbi:MAG: ATP-binding protein [Shinella sp.]|nr:ATP-binding protein [Shinella sp.]